VDLAFWLGSSPGAWGWRVLHLVALWLPMVGYYRYWKALIPGAGPQGGEAMFVLILLHGAAFGVLGAIDGAIAAGLRGAGPGATIAWFIGLGLAACAGCWLLTSAVAHAAAADSTPSQRLLGWLGTLVMAPGLLLGLFGVIARPV